MYEKLIGMVDEKPVVLVLFPFADDVCEGDFFDEEALEKLLQTMKTMRRLNEERTLEINTIGHSDIKDPYADTHVINFERVAFND